ncbi:MAG TPA: hypothetical protein VKD72_17780, partial [Gemmataceae bacterium]|nr:hypothetical protein [Gemmataceae bacterium]
GYGLRPLGPVQRALFGAAALAILIPPNAFPGAQALDWVGLGGSVVLLGYEFARRRAGAG